MSLFKSSDDNNDDNHEKEKIIDKEEEYSYEQSMVLGFRNSGYHRHILCWQQKQVGLVFINL